MYWLLYKATMYSKYTRGLHRGSSTCRMSVVVLQGSPNFCAILKIFLCENVFFNYVVAWIYLYNLGVGTSFQ